MTTWFFIQSGPGSAAFNMALDEALLEAAPRLRRPVLRYYAWTQPAASFGYFQKFSEIERATPLRPLVRRPTGGGLVPHEADWTYSLAFPPSDPWYGQAAIESYRGVHEWVRTAFEKLDLQTELASCCRKAGPGQCFIGHEKFDVLWRGRKIAGAAQRRSKTALLVQGSVQPPPLRLARIDWERAMREAGRGQHGIEWVEFHPDQALAERAASLAAEKYSREEYNRKR